MRSRIRDLVNETLAEKQGPVIGEDQLVNLIDSGRSEGGEKVLLQHRLLATVHESADISHSSGS